MDTSSKPIWASKTIIGAIITMVATISLSKGVDLGDPVQLTETVMVLIGAATSIYGRLSAKQVVHITRRKAVKPNK